MRDQAPDRDGQTATLHDNGMSYRNEQLLWQQVAEFTYDSYQIRSRVRR